VGNRNAFQQAGLSTRQTDVGRARLRQRDSLVLGQKTAQVRVCLDS